MSIVSNEIANLDGKHHGIKIETPPVTETLIHAAANKAKHIAAFMHSLDWGGALCVLVSM